MIPLLRPVMPPLDIISEYLQTCYETGVWSNFGSLYFGAVQTIKAMTGRYPVVVSSATSAIDLALSMAPRPPSMVAVPDFTHAGSLVGIRNNVAEPLIVSCEKATMAMDRERFEVLCRIGDIDAAVIVNPFGYGIDRAFYADTARRYGVYLVFDYAGAWTDFDFDDEFPTVYSLHATKSMPVGEGGVILFAREAAARRARSLTNFSTAVDRRIEEPSGQNFKISEITAAVLCAQLDDRQYGRVTQRIQHRRELIAFYGDELRRPKVEARAPSLCVFPFPEMRPGDFEAFAISFGFVAKQYYIPLRTMPGYLDAQQEGRFCPELDRCMALPSDCSMEEAAEVVKAIQRFLPE